MRLLPAIVLVAVGVMPGFGKPTEAEQKELQEWARSLDKAAIHKAVLDHERDPLGKDAERIRPVLVVHFEAVDYLVCGDVLGPLAKSKNDAHQAVMWQIVFGSGDWVEQNPDHATDIEAYTLAGLESGLRAYENVLARKPKARLPLLDELVKHRNDGKLLEYVKEHPCRKE